MTEDDLWQQDTGPSGKRETVTSSYADSIARNGAIVFRYNRHFH